MLSIQHVIVLICRIRNNFETDLQVDKNRIDILITNLLNIQEKKVAKI